MPDVHNSLRLGDLLVEKGLITRPQLRQAIEIQQALQSQRFGGKNINGRTELGEILIELGFISRHQLQSNLNWQRRLKATTAVMVFIAPLLTAACGGGGGSTGSNNTGNVKTEIASSQASVASPSTKPDQESNFSSAISNSSKSTSSANAGSPPPGTSSVAPASSSSSAQGKVSSSSSLPKFSSSVSSSKASSVSSSKISSISSRSSAQSSLSSSSSSKSNVDGPVQLYWNVPTQRENGDYLDITEIGGYEVRYKLKTESDFKIVRITDGFLDAYYFNYLSGDYQFQIATFDKDGLYSDFIDIDPS